eukprot:47121-Chlamydomonas_euryale.AAC.1
MAHALRFDAASAVGARSGHAAGHMQPQASVRAGPGLDGEDEEGTDPLILSLLEQSKAANKSGAPSWSTVTRALTLGLKHEAGRGRVDLRSEARSAEAAAAAAAAAPTAQQRDPFTFLASKPPSAGSDTAAPEPAPAAALESPSEYVARRARWVRDGVHDPSGVTAGALSSLMTRAARVRVPGATVTLPGNSGHGASTSSSAGAAAGASAGPEDVLAAAGFVREVVPTKGLTGAQRTGSASAAPVLRAGSPMTEQGLQDAGTSAPARLGLPAAGPRDATPPAAAGRARTATDATTGASAGGRTRLRHRAL